MKKINLIAAIILCFSVSANAQLLKRLGKSIERAATKTVERKVEQQTTKETGNVFDKTVDKTKSIGKSKGKTGSMPGLTNTEPAASYSFDHRVEMRFKSGKDVMDVDYFIPKEGNFLCLMYKDKRVKDNFLAVYDIDREAMFTYMENKGQKIKMGVEFKTVSAADEAQDESMITIKATGKTKKIQGYNCKEYKMTGKDMTANIWVTKDVDVRFPTNYYKIKQKKSPNQAWMEDVDGWAMEMVLIDNSRRKPRTITMECLSINKSNLKINSNEYSNIGR